MYTVEIYRADRRTRSGERLVRKEDLAVTRSDAQGIQEAWELNGYRVEIFDTYVTRLNAATGQQYQERYDTPFFCSPSSDAYWSL